MRPRIEAVAKIARQGAGPASGIEAVLPGRPDRHQYIGTDDQRMAGVLSRRDGSSVAFLSRRAMPW